MAPAGPVIELPDSQPATAPASDSESPEGDDSGLYGLKNDRLERARDTTLGGYGELHYNLASVTGPGDSEAQLDLHRLVLFIAHRFSDRIRFYSELEVEHAFVGDGLPGEVGVEQAYLDYLLLEESLGLRAGIVLVPMGIINQWHEPPIFHGVERPSVDRVIIPTTWREGGIGIFGEPVEGLRYELYVVGGLDPSGFSAGSGLRGGRQQVAEARADGLAVTGRVEAEPTLGVVAGLSGYFGMAGPNADLVDAAGDELDADVTVVGGAADVRVRRAGFEARAVGALFGVGDTRVLREAVDAEGNALGIDAGAMLWGAYGEVAYDVLWTLRSEHQLLPFVRVERYDTLAKVRGRAETAADEAFGVTELVLGASYRPLPAVVFKADFLLRSPDGPTKSVGQLNLGTGLMF